MNLRTNATIFAKFVQVAGTTTLGNTDNPNFAGGNINGGAAGVDIQGGVLQSIGGQTRTVFGSGGLTNAGTIKPGSDGAAGRIRIDTFNPSGPTGKLTLLNASHIIFELGGVTAGTQHDQITMSSSISANATAALDGTIAVGFINGFENTITSSDTFTILTTESAMSGLFDNVANGGRIATIGGEGSFLVTYNPTSVVLSNFIVPEPGTVALLLVSLTSALSRPRRRRL